MSKLLDSSVVLASLNANEPSHEPCSALLSHGGHYLYVHAIAEVFSTLTGGMHAPRIDANIAWQLLKESVLPFVKSVALTERDMVSALADARDRGVRGGAVYDYLHLVAAKKAGVDAVATLDVRHFQALTRPGDPRIENP